MTFVRCPECDGDIPEEALQCVHCGHFLAPKESSAEASSAFGTLKHSGRKFLGRAQPLAGSMLDSLRDSTSSGLDAAGERLSDLATGTLDKIFESHKITASVLPSGSGSSDFEVSLSLDEALEALWSGVLVRPQLAVWAHRADLDRSQLASMLEQSFSRQIAEFRAARENRASNELNQAMASAEENGKPGRSWTKHGAVAAGLAMLLVANPVLDLVLLLVAVTSGADVILEALRESRANLAASRAGKKHVAEGEKISATVKAKRAAFRAALLRLKVQVHPRLAALAEDFAVVDNAPLLPQTPSTEQPPDVVPALQDQGYRSRLAAWYQPLLEARLESWMGDSVQN